MADRVIARWNRQDSTYTWQRVAEGEEEGDESKNYGPFATKEATLGSIVHENPDNVPVEWIIGPDRVEPEIVNEDVTPGSVEIGAPPAEASGAPDA